MRVLLCADSAEESRESNLTDRHRAVMLVSKRK